MGISRHTTIEKALKTHPDVLKVFYNNGMTCICCLGAAAESIERGATMHGVDVEGLLREINSLITRNEQKGGMTVL